MNRPDNFSLRDDGRLVSDPVPPGAPGTPEREARCANHGLPDAPPVAVQTAAVRGIVRSNIVAISKKALDKGFCRNKTVRYDSSERDE
jgi:hypothetical protein